MPNTSFPLTPRTPISKLLPLCQLNREERNLLRCYRALSVQDRDAVRWMLFAIEQTSRSQANPYSTNIA